MREKEDEFLHEEMSAIMSYVSNFSLTKKEKSDYKKIVKVLADLIKINTKIEVLEKEKNSLTSITELYSTVGLDEKKLKEQWSKKNAEYIKQCKTYQEKKKLYKKL